MNTAFIFNMLIRYKLFISNKTVKTGFLFVFGKSYKNVFVITKIQKYTLQDVNYNVLLHTNLME